MYRLLSEDNARKLDGPGKVASRRRRERLEIDSDKLMLQFPKPCYKKKKKGPA